MKPDYNYEEAKEILGKKEADKFQKIYEKELSHFERDKLKKKNIFKKGIIIDFVVALILYILLSVFSGWPNSINLGLAMTIGFGTTFFYFFYYAAIGVVDVFFVIPFVVINGVLIGIIKTFPF